MMESSEKVEVCLKSGASYLLGNASIGMLLFPGGGFTQDGSIGSPVYKGLAADAGFVVETDATANVIGYVKYFDE